MITLLVYMKITNNVVLGKQIEQIFVKNEIIKSLTKIHQHAHVVKYYLNTINVHARIYGYVVTSICFFFCQFWSKRA